MHLARVKAGLRDATSGFSLEFFLIFVFEYLFVWREAGLLCRAYSLRAYSLRVLLKSWLLINFKTGLSTATGLWFIVKGLGFSVQG